MAQPPPPSPPSSMSLPDNPIAARMYYTRYPSIMTERAYIYNDIKGWSRANDEDKHRTKLLVSSFFHRTPKSNTNKKKKKKRKRPQTNQNFQYNYHHPSSSSSSSSSMPSDTIHYTITPKIRRNDPFLVHGIRLNEQLGKTIITNTTISKNVLATNSSTKNIIDHNPTDNPLDSQRTHTRNNSIIMTVDDNDDPEIVLEKNINHTSKMETFFQPSIEYQSSSTTNVFECYQQKEPVPISTNNNNEILNEKNEKNEKDVIISKKTPSTNITTTPSHTTTNSTSTNNRIASTTNNNNHTNTTKQNLKQTTIHEEPLPIQKPAPALVSPKSSLSIRPIPPHGKNKEQISLGITDNNKANVKNNTPTHTKETINSNNQNSLR